MRKSAFAFLALVGLVLVAAPPASANHWMQVGVMHPDGRMWGYGDGYGFFHDRGWGFDAGYQGGHWGIGVNYLSNPSWGRLRVSWPQYGYGAGYGGYRGGYQGGYGGQYPQFNYWPYNQGQCPGYFNLWPSGGYGYQPGYRPYQPCRVQCWQEPVYQRVLVPRYDRRGRLYWVQEYRFVGYRERCVNSCGG